MTKQEKALVRIVEVACRYESSPYYPLDYIVEQAKADLKLSYGETCRMLRRLEKQGHVKFWIEVGVGDGIPRTESKASFLNMLLYAETKTIQEIKEDNDV